jgi:prepilin-type N-terminal cleavage/methylation domain-containing protein
VSGKSKGFTLLEVLVVIFLIGLMTTLFFVNIRTLSPIDERTEFFTRLNSLVQFAWNNALTSNKVHKVVFDLDSNQVYLEEQENSGSYKPVTGAYINPIIEWPENLEIQQAFIEHNQDELAGLGQVKRKVWFFIMPDGIAQAVTINGLDYATLETQGKATQFSLVLNPFSAQFTSYDSFQQP